MNKTLSIEANFVSLEISFSFLSLCFLHFCLFVLDKIDTNNKYFFFLKLELVECFFMKEKNTTWKKQINLKKFWKNKNKTHDLKIEWTINKSECFFYFLSLSSFGFAFQIINFFSLKFQEEKIKVDEIFKNLKKKKKKQKKVCSFFRF